MNYRKKLSICDVKIDKNFVFDMVGNAEGVENQQTLTQLELLGCTVVQGFYFSPAVKADKLLDVIKKIESEY